jgi:hypothetical protein
MRCTDPPVGVEGEQFLKKIDRTPTRDELSSSAALSPALAQSTRRFIHV